MLSESERQRLLETARRSIAHGLTAGKPLPVDVGVYEEPLREIRATFVTLHLNGQLRGCIGSLEARRALIHDVADNAFNAAFRDPRFLPLMPHEAGALHLHISVLSPPEAMAFSHEADLLAQIRPNVDGLIFSDGGHRGTFLPSVWESLPDPRLFLVHLKQKAGFGPDHWSPTVKVWRYTAEDVE